jgi:hypothetical protein
MIHIKFLPTIEGLHKWPGALDNVALRPSYEPEPSPANASLCVKEFMCTIVYTYTCRANLRCMTILNINNPYVHSSVPLKCFKCFIDMLQVFHTDVAKVDQDVTYVAMVVHVCCKRLSPMFHLFFPYDVSVFIWRLHILHAYVASVLSRCYVCLQ